jgi:hypothetical protein
MTRYRHRSLIVRAPWLAHHRTRGHSPTNRPWALGERMACEPGSGTGEPRQPGDVYTESYKSLAVTCQRARVLGTARPAGETRRRPGQGRNCAAVRACGHAYGPCIRPCTRMGRPLQVMITFRSGDLPVDEMLCGELRACRRESLGMRYEQVDIFGCMYTC